MQGEVSVRLGRAEALAKASHQIDDVYNTSVTHTLILTSAKQAIDGDDNNENMIPTR